MAETPTSVPATEQKQDVAQSSAPEAESSANKPAEEPGTQQGQPDATKNAGVAQESSKPDVATPAETNETKADTDKKEAVADANDSNKQEAPQEAAKSEENKEASKDGDKAAQGEVSASTNLTQSNATEPTSTTGNQETLESLSEQLISTAKVIETIKLGIGQQQKA